MVPVPQKQKRARFAEMMLAAHPHYRLRSLVKDCGTGHCSGLSTIRRVLFALMQSVTGVGQEDQQLEEGGVMVLRV